MRYDDFVLQIEPAPGDAFEARVLQSPAGEGRAPLRLDLEGASLERLVEELTRSTRKARDSGPSTREIVRRHGEERGDPRKIGAALFQSTFSGQVGSLFDRSLGGLSGSQDRGLRIKLKLQGDDPRLVGLAALPWELLRRGDTEDYLGLDRRTSVVRYLDVPRPRPLISLPRVLRILVVVAEPETLDPLDLREELRLLQRAWRGQKGVEVDVLERASLANLRDALTEKTYHVLHFMGHGGFDRRTGEGVLYFESRQGQAVPVTGLALAAKLKDHISLGLVFLNACNTGRAAASRDAQPFAGVASALVFGGLPAVLAMQFPISDTAAIRFGQAFYRRLAAGISVDEAVIEGRQAIHSADPGNIEWATPVLFLRTADGNVFSRPPRSSRWKTSVGILLSAAVLFFAVLLQPAFRSYFLPVSYALESTLVESTIEGLKIQLSKVEMRDDGRMRLYYEVINESPEAHPVGFDLDQAYLADEFGNRYEILATKASWSGGQDLPAGVPVSEVVAPGDRLESWVELSSPLDGARKLAVNLATQDRAIAFPWLEVDLPDYPTRLGRVSEAYQPPPGVQALAVSSSIDFGLEDLQSQLTRVEMREDQRMRWNLALLNQSRETQQIEIDFKRSYLLDENGQRYGVVGYEHLGEADRGWAVAGALRAERWIEFPSPRNGARNFRVVFYSKESQKPLTELEVQLPEYDSPLGRAATVPELGLLPAAVDLIDSIEPMSSRLVGVESLENGQQRWRVELYNAGAEPIQVGFDYPRSYLADAHGQRYSVRGSERELDVLSSAAVKTLAAGERSFHFIDFEAPMTDPGSWWLVLFGTNNAHRWLPASIGELSFPRRAFRRRPEPRPPANTEVTMSLGQPLEPCLGDIDCRLDAVYLRPGGMRWSFGFLNRGPKTGSVTIDAAAVRLEDEHGNRYRVLASGAEDGFGGRLAPHLAAGLWLDFGAPIEDARSFTVDLGKKLGIEPFEVQLQAYPAALSARSRATAPFDFEGSEDVDGSFPSLAAHGDESFALLEGEVPIETSLAGFQAKLVDIERFDDKSRVTIELWNGSAESVHYGFDLDRTQLSDGIMSSPSRVLRADTNADPVAVENREILTLQPGERATHWFEFVGPRPAAKLCFVTLETQVESQVSFGLLQVDLKN